MDPRSAQQLLDQYAAKLGEHFESVQILVSHTDATGTSAFKSGLGNWYARQGMAHEFIEMDKAQDHAFQLSQVMRRDDDA